MRAAIIGYGNVGTAIARALVRAGYHVTLATNPQNPNGGQRARDQRPELAGVSLAAPDHAVAGADLVVLAVPFPALDHVLPPLADHLAGTIVIDATNPVGPGLTHALESGQSGAHHVAALAPRARVVKTLNVYGFENLAAPPEHPGGVWPAMPYAGDDPQAKHTLAELLRQLGWDPIDVGGLDAALDLEHLALLWVRMVRLGGQDPNFLWAALRGTNHGHRSLDHHPRG